MAAEMCSYIYQKSCQPGKLPRKQPLFLTASQASIVEETTQFLVSRFSETIAHLITVN